MTNVDKDDLSSEIEQITKYLNDNDFNIFYASGLFDDAILPEVTWNNDVIYEKFFVIAKKEGINTIIFDSDTLTDTQIEKIDEILSDEKNIPNIEEWKDTFRDRKEQGKKAGAYTFAYVKGGILYCLRDKTQWNDDLYTRFSRLKISSIQQQTTQNRKELPKELETLSIDEIGEEFMEFLLKEFPKPTTRDVYMAERAFWDKKGISMISADGIILSEKIRKYADKKITDKEKEKIPEIVESCLTWAKENSLKKVFKRNLDVFLDEQEITLSWETKDRIYNKVNMKLKDI